MMSDLTDNIRRHLFTLLGVMLCGYFCYHMVWGERSYLALRDLNVAAVKAEAEYARLSAYRAGLEEDVVMLRPGAMDKDFLEERVREVLGFVYRDEVEVF